MKQSTQQGYILVLTLMILSIAVIVVTRFALRGTVHVHFDKTMIEREQAKQVALGGIQVALAQLSLQESSTGGQQKTNSTEFYKKVVPALNRFQDYKLVKDVDGIDGTLSLAISCEQGKIDLNQLFPVEDAQFDLEKQKELKKSMQNFFAQIKKVMKDKDLFSVFEKFIKKQQFLLNDATELMTIPEFQKLFLTKIFYEPPTKDSSKKRPLYLMDIFTVFSDKKNIQPWFLSDSLCGLLGLKRAEYNDQEKREKLVADVLTIKNLNSPEQKWDKQLQPLYGKDFKSLPKDFQMLFDFSFEPTVFSVLSYGTVGAITQKIFAIIEKRSSSQHGDAPYALTKLYWL
ncbi:MAG: hypothetical protein AB7R69_02300 [Candidatus Babeliales bacterium]